MNLLQTTAAAMILGGSIFAGGCQHERSTAIPPAAARVAEGNGLLTYTAGSDGTVYVFNRNANKVAFSGPLQKGEAIVIDAEKNQILIDDRIATENTLTAGHTYRIFFAPTTMMNPNTM
jgi:hypothetical protein